MVTQTAKATRTRKPAPPVLVQPADVHAGLYGALSSDGSTWYSVNVATRSCTCPSGAHGFTGVKANGGTCKHVVAARTIARALASMSPAARAVALRMTNIRVRVEAVDLVALDTPLAHQAAPVAGRSLSLEEVQALGTALFQTPQTPAGPFAGLAEALAQLPPPSFSFRSHAPAPAPQPDAAAALLECYGTAA